MVALVQSPSDLESDARHEQQTLPQDRKTIPEGASASVLVVESRSEGARQNPSSVVAVPATLSRLVVDGDASSPSFEPHGFEFPEHGLPVFEHVEATTGGAKLLMLRSPSRGVRLNGLPAPLVAPLSPGDQLALGADTIFHVSRIQRASPINPPAEIVGKTCEVCLVDFTPTTRVVVCSCGAARHMEGEEVAADDRLECAALGACPCGCALQTTEGLVYWPTGVS